MRHLTRIRQSLARSPVGGVVRALRLQKLLDLPYEALLRMRGHFTVDAGGRALKFVVATKEEAGRIVSGVGEMGHIESICGELRPGDVFYDIGSNIGMFTVAAGVLSDRQVTIHAFEPEPRTRERLERNIVLNDLAGCAQAHAVALSDEAGEFALRVSGRVGVGTHSLVEGHARSDLVDTVQVEVVRPDEYARTHDLPTPTVVKCDVEGAEGGVIRGLEGWLRAGAIRRLDVEFHLTTLAQQGESADALDALITGHGYDASNRAERGDTINVTYRRREGAEAPAGAPA